MTGEVAPRSRTGRQLATAAVAHGWTVRVTPAAGTTDRTRLVADQQTGRRRKALVAEPCLSEGVRLSHPDGRGACAVFLSADGKGWSGDDAWIWGPRAQLTQTTPAALIDLLGQIEEETVNEEPVARIIAEAYEKYADVRPVLPEDHRGAYAAGYSDGRQAATEHAGDQYGEGYAAGLAALAGQTEVWVKTRRRLDALRPGDVILGKGGRWFTVTTSEADRREWVVIALAFDGPRQVCGNPSRLVDVVEPIAVAGLLDALRAEGIAVKPADDVSRETGAGAAA